MSRLTIGPACRMLSPSLVSTLITSAPSSARIWVANGPITTVVRSMTLTLLKGPAMFLHPDRATRPHRSSTIAASRASAARQSPMLLPEWRRKHHTESPAAMNDSTTTSIGTKALVTLRDVFGYPAFRDAQADIVEHITNGGDALV